MNASTYQRVKAVVDTAMDLDGAEREAAIASACAGDPELRAHVESLLAHLTDPAVDLEQARDALAQDIRRGLDGSLERSIDIPGYRILHRLGEGGMGVVLLAEQLRPRRRVALKVIRAERMSPEARGRFEREANVLGRLSHPGVAQVFEVGSVETSLGTVPFIAMEYVDGPSLLDHAREARLDVRERLRLMTRICQAVHHAHEQGVIHRDLKPSNILVRAPKSSGDDSSSSVLDAAQPKVVDFGVARLVGADAADVTLRTETGQLVGTIAYMSPEQVAPDHRPVDRRSDVYALGVILCQLLTDRLPYRLDGVPLPEAGRIIRDEDPELPGTTSAPLRGDVDTILRKALEKDPARRYASAEELALDILRYLDDEPIVARRPTRMYQVRKFARRHRALVGGVGATTLALVAGLVGTSIALVDARHKGEAAAREAAMAGAINDFLINDLLAQNDPHVQRDRDIRLRVVLDRAAERVAAAFADQPVGGAAIQHAIGHAYYRLGLYEEARLQLDAAATTFEAQLGTADERTIRAISLLASTLWQLDDLEGSMALARRTLELSERGLGPDHPRTIGAINALAVCEKTLGHYDEAERLYLDAIARWRRFDEERVELSKALGNLGVMYTHLDRQDEAERVHREALDIRRRLLGEEHPDTVFTMVNLGEVYWATDRFDEAAELWTAAYEARMEVLGPDHPDTLMGLYSLGLLEAARRDYVAAERVYRDVVARRTAALGADHRHTIIARNALANALWNQQPHRFAEALELHESVHQAWLERYGPDHADTQMSARNVRRLLAHWAWTLVDVEAPSPADVALAIDLAERAASLSERRDPEILDTLAVALHRAGRAEEALATIVEARALLDADDPDRARFDARVAEFGG